jgi:hypothetical protein
VNTIEEICAVKLELGVFHGTERQCTEDEHDDEDENDSQTSEFGLKKIEDGRGPGRLRSGYNPSVDGSSQLPDSAERKIASMTAMLRTLPSNGTGNSVLSRMLREKRSP